MHIKKLHRRVAQIEFDRASYGDLTHLKNWSRWMPAGGGGSWCRSFFEVWLCVVWFVVLGGSCCWFFCDVVTRITWIWKKIYVWRVWYDLWDSPFFSSEIISTYIGCGINNWRRIKFVQDWPSTRVSRVNLLKWLRKKRDMVTLWQCNVTEQYIYFFSCDPNMKVTG